MIDRRRLALPGRDAWVGLLLALASFALFVWRIGTPATLYFDETHYVPAARALLARTAPVNIEHPLFAKTMIAAGIAVFGDNSLGWRLPSALFASLSVAAFFWLSLLIFKNLRPAVLATLLLVFNQTLFVQARIAMLEMPMTAFLLMAAGCFVAARRSDHGVRWEYAGAAALGLAIGSKWLAAPYAALALGHVGFYRLKAVNYDTGGLVDRVIPDIFKLTVVMLAVYFATFAPAFFYKTGPMTVSHLIGFQFEMLHAQQAPLASHPYQSAIWQWLLMLRPIWYLFAKQTDSYQAVLLIGNPVIYWGGLAIAVLSIIFRMDRGKAFKSILAIYVFSVLIWILIPKHIGFFYYYNLSAIILCLVVAAFCESFGPRGVRVLGWITMLAGGFFLYFLPIISAEALPADDTWTGWVWMKSWY